MRNSFALLLIAGTALAGCDSSGNDGTGEDFESRVDGGATCAELFEIRNAVDPAFDRIETMNETLREIGCFSSSSNRSD